MTLFLTPAHCRAARGLLDWTQDDLARAAGLSRSTVRDFETGRHDLHRATEAHIVETLQQAGVRLIPADEGGPGVQLRQTGTTPP
ncbi:helix-turn-helix domain-containing protein [Alsobacter sp. SYSU M60028]|uniref:Helix-turn-helix domain-containing protein n=1 Tax=Alsobacter ponti TaxID=2962936 RepID=A0ABT1LIE0_9HYPH|nr:helix-turn-helix transcriptional regulator [Alsobacter ponti]MCP8940903.1 helix-turn-helix domain-containing protein [Alsobacter ponti]